MVLSHLLINAGHRVTAIDLSGSATNPNDAAQIRSWSQNNEPLVHLFNALLPNDKVILVGHSMGGLNLTCIMEQFPHKIGAAVFVAAFMPLSGTSVIQLLNEVEARIRTWGDTEFNYGRGQHKPPTSFKFGKQFSRRYLYQNSPSEDIALAEMMVRTHPLCEGEVVYTGKRYGRVKRVYIVAKEDKAICEELQRKMIAENPPDGVYFDGGIRSQSLLLPPCLPCQHSAPHFKHLSSLIHTAWSVIMEGMYKCHCILSSVCEVLQNGLKCCLHSKIPIGEMGLGVIPGW